jgi:uncharacterized protein YbjQ (UPF0145 family)
MDVLIFFGMPAALLLFSYVTGSILETRHFRELAEREEALGKMTVVTFSPVPDGWNPRSAELVMGSVVVSLDHFKRFLAGLRAIVGGRIKAYEPLLDRARREALLRMMETANERGLDTIVNVRLETSRLASSRKNGKGTAGVEILAFGTGLQTR